MADARPAAGAGRAEADGRRDCTGQDGTRNEVLTGRTGRKTLKGWGDEALVSMRIPSSGETRPSSWIQQASAIPGWTPGIRPGNPPPTPPVKPCVARHERRHLLDKVNQMSGRAYLGDLELVLLLALARLGDDAYGVSIRDEVEARSGRALTPGTLYPTLDRLERKGFVRSYLGDATPERGGRAKRCYRLQPRGLRALRRSWQMVTALGNGLGRRLGEGSAR
jgi:DNA-binding PadR family transcriptional regulator